MDKVTIKLLGPVDADAICSMLRGILFSNGQSDGMKRSNKEFLRGTTITFGAAPMAQKFVDDLRRLFSSSVNNRLSVTLHG